MKFEVTLSSRQHCYGFTIVEAENIAQAKEKALALSDAGEIDWNAREKVERNEVTIEDCELHARAR